MSYEERLRALGLDTVLQKSAIHKPHGFTEEMSSATVRSTAEPEYLSENRSMVPAPPPLEDLTHLNPRSNVAPKDVNRKWWNSLTPEQQAARRHKSSLAGKIGGTATKRTKHRNGI